MQKHIRFRQHHRCTSLAFINLCLFSLLNRWGNHAARFRGNEQRNTPKMNVQVADHAYFVKQERRRVLTLICRVGGGLKQEKQSTKIVDPTLPPFGGALDDRWPHENITFFCDRQHNCL